MTLTEDAAELLSRLSDGALRDALSLLDQCSGGKEINKEHVLDVLGLAGNLQTAQMMKYILSRETQAALLLLNQLYQGGKDVSALLGELSTLARDLLIRATAPEGGAALLSGGYDTAMMDGLSAGITPTRLIHITTRLQDTLAALPLSANRRTDAELCLMRLCDESLCGDLTALAARVARLEEGGLPGNGRSQRSSVQREAAPSPVRSERKTAAPVEQRREKPASAPASAPPPWEDPAPIGGDVPPWEEPAFQQADSRPPLDDRDAPPPDDSDAPPLTDAESAGMARHASAAGVRTPSASPADPVRPSAPASGGDDVWSKLIERYKDQVMPMYQFMLDDARGTMEGDMLVVRCGDDLTLETLDCPAVTEVLKSVTGDYLGRSIGVRYTLSGKNDPLPQEDKLEELIRQGRNYDSFTVK